MKSGIIFTNDDWKHLPRAVLAIVEARAALTGDARFQVMDLAEWKVTEAEVGRRATKTSPARETEPVLNRASEREP